MRRLVLLTPLVLLVLLATATGVDAREVVRLEGRPGRIDWGQMLFTLPFLLLFVYLLLSWGRGRGSEFLCDRCQYNDARYCARPERPNATRCPDFKGS